MQQIADWLEKLGMSEYAQRFAANGINVAALPRLTDQDLAIRRLGGAAESYRERQQRHHYRWVGLGQGMGGGHPGGSIAAWDLQFMRTR
jgi:hypothetical protein